MSSSAAREVTMRKKALSPRADWLLDAIESPKIERDRDLDDQWSDFWDWARYDYGTRFRYVMVDGVWQLVDRSLQ
jgi:hypothetical protein